MPSPSETAKRVSFGGRKITWGSENSISSWSLKNNAIMTPPPQNPILIIQAPLLLSKELQRLGVVAREEGRRTLRVAAELRVALEERAEAAAAWELFRSRLRDGGF